MKLKLDPVEAEKDQLEQLQQDFTHRQITKIAKKKKTFERHSATLARVKAEQDWRSSNYDPNKSGIPASGKPALGFKKKYTNIQPMPKDTTEQNLIADKLMQWLQDNPECTKLAEFPLSLWISPYKFFKLAKDQTNEHFTDCVNLARAEIANRAHKLLLSNPAHLMKIHDLHDDEMKEWIMEQKSASKSDTKQGVFNVIMPDLGDSDKVPSKE